MTSHEMKTVEGKRRFIRELCDRIRDDVMRDAEKMPEAWDGHELRRLLADRFEESASMSAPMENRRKARRRDYENARATLGL